VIRCALLYLPEPAGPGVYGALGRALWRKGKRELKIGVRKRL